MTVAVGAAARCRPAARRLAVALAAPRDGRRRAGAAGRWTALRDRLAQAGLGAGLGGRVRGRERAARGRGARGRARARGRPRSAVAVAAGVAAIAAPFALIAARARARRRATARGLARCRRPPGRRRCGPGCRSPRPSARSATAGRARDPRRVRCVRARLPRDRQPLARARRAQGAPRRPGRRPHRRDAADGARGRRHRAADRAAQPRRLPAAELAVRSEVEARQSWVVNAARLGVAAPWIVLLLLASRPEAAAAYNSPPGWLVLGVGLVVTVVAYRVMIALGRLPEERRWFA